MKKISFKQYMQMVAPKKSIKPVISKIERKLLKLNIGQGYFIKKNEWVMKTPVSMFAFNIATRNEGYKFSTCKVPKGWVILRIREKVKTKKEVKATNLKTPEDTMGTVSSGSITTTSRTDGDMLYVWRKGTGRLEPSTGTSMGESKSGSVS